MPITPFHFGPAAFLKALIPRQFSFLIFCYSLVVVDLEVAYHIVTLQVPLHGFTHTYLGALVIGIFCGVTGPPLHSLAVSLSARSAYRSLILSTVTLKVSLMSALIGTISHVILDSIMHRDMKPFSPVSETNILLGSIDLQLLHLFCVVTGIIGVIWCRVISKRSITKGSNGESAANDSGNLSS